MSNLIGKSLGRYHILEQLGEGGMAIVYKAYDTRLETDVAVKVIRTENILPSVLERSLKRFEREAKSLARLTHPNIVKVTDYGEFEGKPYLVMPYLPGGTLKDRIKQGQIPWQEAVRLLLPIAQALEYAHKQNIIHRDVKPSNIMLTESGQPMLTDFGVAKLFDMESTADLTGTGMGIGTPEYMAPEQWQGQVSVQTDVYALGVVLYEMVTGRRPYTAETPAALLLKQANDPLPRPRSFVPGFADGTEKIIFKALAKKQEDRYKDMAGFITALDELLKSVGSPQAKTLEKEFLTGTVSIENVETTDAIQVSSPIRANSWKLVGFLALALGIILGIGVLITKAELRADSAPTIAITVQPLTEATLPNPSPSLAAPITTLTLSPTSPPLTTEFTESRGSDNSIVSLNNIENLQILHSWTNDLITGYSVAWNPDGSALAISTSDGVYLLDAQTLKTIKKFESGRDVYRHIVYLPDGKSIIFVTNQPSRYDLSSGNKILEFADGWGISISPDGTRLAASTGQEVKLLSTETGINALTLRVEYATSTIFSPDGRFIITGSRDDAVRIWDTNNGDLIKTMRGHQDDVISVAISPNGSIIASGSESGEANQKFDTVFLWDMGTGSILKTLVGQTDSIWSLDFSPDSKLLAIGSSKAVQIWSVPEGNLLYTFESTIQDLNTLIVDVAFSPDGSRLAILEHKVGKNGALTILGILP